MKYKLRELIEIKNGCDYKHQGRGNIPVYGTGGEICRIDKSLYDGESVLLPRKGSLANIMYVNDEFWTVDTMYWTVINKQKILPLYLYYYLSLLDLSCRDSGSTLPSMTFDAYYSIEIDIPSIDEQKLIVKTIKPIEDKIKLNNQINDNLSKLAKELYDYWFVQFDFPNEDGKPYKSSGGKMVFNKDIKREIPNTWEVSKLGEFISTKRGVTYTSKNLSSSDVGIPMINLASFSPGSSEYNVSGIKYYDGHYKEENIISPYDLVICNTQQTEINYKKDIIGKSLLVPNIFRKNILSSHHVTTIKTRRNEEKGWLHELINSDYFHKYITGYTSGTNIMGLDITGLESFLTAIPPQELLKKYNKIKQEIENKKSLNILENIKLTSLKEELLPLLMNGQVTIKN